MFLLNIGYQWGVSETVEMDGAVFRAAGQDMETALRRPAVGGLQEKLFDPQLHLLDYELDAEAYPTLLSKLATYPWFGMAPPSYESEEGAKRGWLSEIRGQIAAIWQARVSPYEDWPTAVGDCVRFQADFGCSKVLIPSGLLSDPEDDLDAYFTRLDDAIEVARDRTDLPLLAMVPIDQGALAHRPAEANQLVSALADGLTARDGIVGVYISLSTETATNMRILNPRVAGSLVRFTSLLAGASDFHTVVNFAECLGLVCLGVGASAYGAGYSLKSRCLHVADHRDQGGGPGYPKFHSASLCMDFYSSTDLEKLRDARLLRYLAADRTEASAPLLDALAQGEDVDEISVPSWAQRMNNLTEARRHFAELHAAAGRRTWSAEATLEWLQDAEAAWSYFSARFEDEPLEVTDGRHLGPWRRAVEAIA